MPNKLAAAAIEDLAIQVFEQLGYSYVYALDIGLDSDSPEQATRLSSKRG
jgi:type I restriction enzyme R subunit